MDQRDLSSDFEKEEDRQLRRVLTMLIWASGGVYLFVLITALFYNDRVLIATTLAGSAGLILPLILLKGRHLHASGLTLMLFMLGTVTLIATVGQGIRDLAMVGYPILFIFAGLALKRPYFRLCVGLTLLAVCWLVFGEFFGWFVTKPFEGSDTNWFYLAGMTVILLVAALAVDLLATNMRRNLEQARIEVKQRKQAEEEIKQLNASLEQRVEERAHELREAQEKLIRQEKLSILGQMAGSVGHELRNPLGVINTSIYYLKMVQPEADAKIKKHLDIIEQQVQTSDKIINDLLGFARLKGVEREQVSIASLLKKTLDRFPIPNTVEVSLYLPDNLPEVFVDPHQMEQVLGNLTTNACQAMMPGGGTLTISAHKEEEMVMIAVNDTGTGITPENMKKVFEPLFTTKPSGIGLGLAVSQKLAEENSGRIEVESEVGKGSTFTLVLPVLQP